MELLSQGTSKRYSDLVAGDFFFVEIGGHTTQCIKASLKETNYAAYLDIADKSGNKEFILSDAIGDDSFVYHIFSPKFRLLYAVENISLEFDPREVNSVIAINDKNYLVVKNGRRHHQVVYLEIETGQFILSLPNGPSTVFKKWEIYLEHDDIEQSLLKFPF